MLYKKLSDKLRKLSIFDFLLIKCVYVIFGVLITAVYFPLVYISIWAYLILAAVATLPLVMFTTSFQGGMIDKAKQYLANNNPSNQVLTLISCTSIGIAIALFFPQLTGIRWYYYLALMLLFAVIPFKKAFFSEQNKK